MSPIKSCDLKYLFCFFLLNLAVQSIYFLLFFSEMKMESDDLRKEITSDMLAQFSKSFNNIPDAIYTIGE